MPCSVEIDPPAACARESTACETAS
jgi:hypothetical protein